MKLIKVWIYRINTFSKVDVIQRNENFWKFPNLPQPPRNPPLLGGKKMNAQMLPLQKQMGGFETVQTQSIRSKANASREVCICLAFGVFGSWLDRRKKELHSTENCPFQRQRIPILWDGEAFLKSALLGFLLPPGCLSLLLPLRKKMVSLLSPPTFFWPSAPFLLSPKHNWGQNKTN